MVDSQRKSTSELQTKKKEIWSNLDHSSAWKEKQGENAFSQKRLPKHLSQIRN